MLTFPFHFLHLFLLLKVYMQRKKQRNKMVSLRFGMFVFAIIFMLLHSVAYSIQDVKMVMVAGDKFAEEERPLLSQHEKDTQYAVSANGKIIGRKMLVKEEHINGEEIVLKKASSSSSGSPKKGGHKVTKRSKKINHNDHDDDHHVKMSSTFMALNSDYHVPRSHPPKNN